MECNITIQYKKIKLADNFFIFRPVKAVTGTLFEEDETEYFISEDGVVLSAIDDIDDLKEDEAIYFYDEVDDLDDELAFLEEDLGEKLDKDDMNHVLTCYFDSFQETVGLVELTDDDDLSVVFTELKDLKEIIQSYEQKIADSFTVSEDQYNELLAIDNLETMKKVLPRVLNVVTTEEKTGSGSPKIQIDLQELEDYVNERVIGHEDQIEDIATTIALNFRTEDPREIERILVAGPTGIGKTETFEVIAEYLKVPFVNYAVTTLSDTGLVGNDIEDILKLVYLKASKNIAKTKRAIVVLDEIDKLAISNNEVAQVNVQQNLLKLLEGQSFEVKLYNALSYPSITIDTRFMSFIGCGAFPSLFEQKRQIGIGAQDSTKKIPITKDFFKFGMIPELIGRFGQIQIFNPLSEKDRYRVLTESKISPFFIKQTQIEREFGVNLKADESYYDALLQTTKDSEIGLRGLKNSVNHSLLKLENQLLKNPGVYHEAMVSKETVEHNRQYILK